MMDNVAKDIHEDYKERYGDYGKKLEEGTIETIWALQNHYIFYVDSGEEITAVLNVRDL